MRRLKSQPETARIPVLVITGLTEDSAQLGATARGMVVDILLTPFLSSRLRELVEAALADRPAQAADVQAQAHQHQRELIGQLIVEGSDALVFHVQRRLCADRTRRRRSTTSADPLTWTEIAEWGKHELLLDADQARLLRRRQSAAPYAARRDTPCSRLLKKAHLPGTHLMGDAAGYPSEGWVVWTFLSSLGENGFFSILLSALGRNYEDVFIPRVSQPGPSILSTPSAREISPPFPFPPLVTAEVSSPLPSPCCGEDLSALPLLSLRGRTLYLFPPPARWVWGGPGWGVPCHRPSSPHVGVTHTRSGRTLFSSLLEARGESQRELARIAWVVASTLPRLRWGAICSARQCRASSSARSGEGNQGPNRAGIDREVWCPRNSQGVSRTPVGGHPGLEGHRQGRRVMCRA